MVTELTGMDVANASLLDEATAAGEAMFMAYNLHNGKRKKFFASRNLFPQTIGVIKTRAEAISVEIVVGEPFEFDHSKTEEFFGVMVQNPDNLGLITDITDFCAQIKEKKTIVCCVADILSLVIVKPPGEMGVDIAVGSTQRFGLPMGFGGPHSGYLACKDEHKRKMPGRIIGVSKDS